MSAAPNLLEVTGLTVRFGGLVALDGVDVVVAEGETVGVIGPNGSGKTTLFNALTGLYAPAGGEIVFRGRRLAGLEAHAIARLGIARTFQASRLCLALSVFDNILIGMHAGRRTGVVDFVVRRGRFLGEMRTAIERVSHLLALFNGDLPRRGFERVGQLPQIDRRRVEICRALAAGPTLLLLDEPSEGLAPVVVQQIQKILRGLKAEGMSMLLVEQNLHFALSLADRHTLLVDGEVKETLTTAQVRARDRELLDYLSV